MGFWRQTRAEMEDPNVCICYQEGDEDDPCGDLEESIDDSLQRVGS